MGDNLAALRGLLESGAVEVLSCERELSFDESAYLEMALHRLGLRRRVNWRWTTKEDRLLKATIRRWSCIRQQKPYQSNNHIRNIAQQLGRTEMAIYRRMERLRKRMKCSYAEATRKGVG